MKKETVNHPDHYNHGSIEAIDVIEDWDLCFHTGNVVKYICRAGKKDPHKLKEDLEKCVWYLQRKIKSLESDSEIEQESDTSWIEYR